jgi:DNA topoisomerase-1
MSLKAPTSFKGMHLASDEERSKLRLNGKPIPPAWKAVFISDDPKARMLARGIDAAGRAQRIYSSEHIEGSAASKFSRTKELAKRTDELDAALIRDGKTNSAAGALALIRHFGLRPGSMADTGAKKQAYGATTLQARHVKQYPETGRTTLSFVGKKGVKITVSTTDKDIYDLMEFWTSGKSGTDFIFDTNDSRVRAYMTAQIGEGFHPKDLRTLLANVIALRMVSTMRRPTTEAKFKVARNKVADAVAKALGNTRAVTLSSYINPTVFAAWEGGLI